MQQPSTRRKFDPDKIIDYNIDYYAVLGLEKGCLPKGKNQFERDIITKILEGAYRISQRKSHPDFPNGSKEKFKLVVRAHTILSDPLLRGIYESGGVRPAMAEDRNTTAMGVDWDKLGAYRKGTAEDTVGYGIYLSICEIAKELNIVPAFHPTELTHYYEWDFAIPDMQKKLSISIVSDEDEILKLTSSDDIDFSLPFKIYMCFPRTQLTYLREPDVLITLEDGSEHIQNGKLLSCIYSDLELLETTKITDVQDYIQNGKLAHDLIALRDGSMLKAKEEEDIQMDRAKYVPRSDMDKNDNNVLQNILRTKSFQVNWNPHAADFLKHLPDSPKKTNV